MVINSDDETNFQLKLWLTNRQVTNLRKDFENNSPVFKNTIIQDDSIRSISW